MHLRFRVLRTSPRRSSRKFALIGFSEVPKFARLSWVFSWRSFSRGSSSGVVEARSKAAVSHRSARLLLSPRLLCSGRQHPDVLSRVYSSYVNQNQEVLR